ncbi:hypothetical protein PSCT_04419 [Pseudomonas sp. SCT]|uniref:anti-sigma factor family protein n=1 Tax=Pseudomonas sp. (strain SCT) TaxID=412955 RepID=UPI000ED6B2D7|nr:zf-HC2 domain-containing protein [Pseudomonas sp. SCT]GCA58199.1 hypothetical protein PSCT_04419 [Pseudomonas sp. SCT]
MLTCRQMSELGSDIIDNHLSVRTRLSVFMHLHMCSRCKRYIKQLELTSQVLQQLPFKNEAVDSQSILNRLQAPD